MKIATLSFFKGLILISIVLTAIFALVLGIFWIRDWKKGELW